MLTYVEGNSLHPERGGASTFARYAFDELWSFVAGWAIILDYLIVLALAAFAVSDYVAAFWHVTGEAGTELVVAGLVLAFVAFMNVRGITAQRLGGVLRLTFARYAFDELWSFVAGWAIILDYLIVLALAAFAVSDYVAAFWHVTGEAGTELVVAGLVLAFVAFMNVRGITAQRLGGVLRLS